VRVDERVVSLEALHVERHGVDREIAAGEVAVQALAKLDSGLPRVWLVGFGSVGRDLDVERAHPRRLENAANRAEFLADGVDLVSPGRRQQLFDLVRMGIGSEV